MAPSNPRDDAADKANTGRHPKLTPARQKKIIEAITAGAYNETAARYGGISERTFYTWMAKGEAGEAPYAQFLQAVKDAQAAAEVRDVALIAKAAQTNWQAAAWKLERKYPDRWGRRDGLTVRGDAEAPVKVEQKTTIRLSGLSDAELATLETLTAKAIAGMESAETAAPADAGMTAADVPGAE